MSQASIQEKKEETASIIDAARRVLRIESESVAGLIDRIDDTFAEVVKLLDQNRGHTIITGVGKSGLIGKKVASTFSSIGVPAFFLHAADGSHGDLGMISKGDLIIAISKSGETEEILKLLPTLNRMRCVLVAITGNPDSTLARRSDYTLDVSVAKEACMQDLIPTSSATAALAMGDALAVALLNVRGFKEEEFAQNHPGGSLGRKLLTTVQDVMHAGQGIPRVAENSNIYDVISEMSQKRLGMTLVMDTDGKLKGVITDGDLRRLIEKNKDISQAVARDFMGTRPKTIKKEALAAKAIGIMEEYAITSLVVSEDGKTPDGVIHLHDLLKAGIV